jgi:hypothetical protein
MSIKQFPGGIITQNPTAPTTASAPGIWTLDQASNYAKQGIWPRTPGTPTIGTATAVTFSTATVTFTAPTDLGTGSVTYTATSTPGSITGTGTSPITVSGLSASTTYTFKVTASTPGGTSPASAASNSITTSAEPAPTVIGQAYAGGYYAGQLGVAGVATHYLVTGPRSSCEAFGKKWKTSDTSTSGTSSDIDGPTNSANMNNASHPAAQFCEALTVGGYTDWYMPAKNEMEICYYNLKPATYQNTSNLVVNPNSIPPRTSGYSLGTPATNPAMTTNTTFQFLAGGTEAFKTQYYWSSTEFSSANGNYSFMSNGNQNGYMKTGSYFYVRATRRVAV